MHKKRGQAWSFDLLIAGILFMGGIVAFYLYARSGPADAEATITYLKDAGEAISLSLMSEGLPEDWDGVNVVKIGLLTESKIDEDKLTRFTTLASSDYERTQQLFGTTAHYYVNLSDTPEVQGIGREPLNYSNLFRVTRFSVYKNTPVTLQIYVWN